MGLISLLVSFFLASAAHVLRRRWEELERLRILQRRNLNEQEIQRREHAAFVWYLIYLSTLASALASFYLTLKGFGLFDWLLK